jgi:hypothetical protein
LVFAKGAVAAVVFAVFDRGPVLGIGGDERAGERQRFEQRTDGGDLVFNPSQPNPLKIQFPWRQPKPDEAGWRSKRQRMSERKSQPKSCGNQPVRQSLTSSRKRALAGVRNGAFKRRQRTAKPCD